MQQARNLTKKVAGKFLNTSTIEILLNDLDEHVHSDPVFFVEKREHACQISEIRDNEFTFYNGLWRVTLFGCNQVKPICDSDTGIPFEAKTIQCHWIGERKSDIEAELSRMKAIGL